MIQPAEIKQLIEAGIPGAQVEVSGDGSHFDARVVSGAFEGMRSLERQRLVYGTLGNRIADGTIHALSIQAVTPAEAAESA